MKIPVPPFNGLIQDLLYSLIVQGICFGYEELEVGIEIAKLTVPKNAVYALIVCEANTGSTAANRGRVVRYKQLGDEAGKLPNNIEGLPLGELCATDIKGALNLANFRAISTDGLTHKLKVEYYK